jgi:hypothetical protein
MSVHFAEGTKSGAPGKGKNEVTEENENDFNAISVIASESKIARTILNNARKEAIQQKIATVPRFNQNNDLSINASVELNKISRRLAWNKHRQINSTEASEIMREQKAQVAAKQLASEIAAINYNQIIRKLQQPLPSVGNKRPRSTGGKRRTRCRNYRKRRHTSLKRK